MINPIITIENIPTKGKQATNICLIETAKANHFEPYAYLKTVFTKLPQATSLEQIESLQPWNCQLFGDYYI